MLCLLWMQQNKLNSPALFSYAVLLPLMQAPALLVYNKNTKKKPYVILRNEKKKPGVSFFRSSK